MSSPKPATQGKETVLLVQAKPKYNFQNARKLPKEVTKPDGLKEKVKNVSLSEPEKLEILHNQLSQETSNGLSKSQASRPVAVVGASRSRIVQEKNTVIKPMSRVASSLATVSFNSASARQNNLPVQENVPQILSSSYSSSSTFPLELTPSVANTSPLKDTPKKAPEIASGTDVSVGVFPRALKCEEDGKIAALEKERDKLKKDLEVQLQVNSELKRLLVASVGEDLFHRVEKLCQDRAQLSVDIGGFSKKLSEDYENLDKVSIQADMWRSKYLASRVMIEELGNARAYYSLQCHDTQDALQQLLNERHELRTNLLEAYKVLQQVKTAFDPLNSHCSSSLRSTNVIELSRACQQLAEAMRFRLLPAHVAVPIDMDASEDIWANSVTRAEQFAHEILSKPSEPIGSLQSGSSRLLPLTGPQEMLIKRYHPDTKHENLTLNCCGKCKGDIGVV
ncbi:golgin-45 [Biomphalaria glabrata]|nr:golgin-45 [Biomphalaria glabrata]